MVALRRLKPLKAAHLAEVQIVTGNLMSQTLLL